MEKSCVLLLLSLKTVQNQGEFNQLVKVYLEIRTAVPNIKPLKLLCPVESSDTKRIRGGERETLELNVKTLQRMSEVKTGQRKKETI